MKTSPNPTPVPGALDVSKIELNSMDHIGALSELEPRRQGGRVSARGDCRRYVDSATIGVLGGALELPLRPPNRSVLDRGSPKAPL